MDIPPVLEVITNRLHYKNLGQPWPDNYKLALSVQGGGMRGILSAGMLLALEDLKVLDIFDVFVGVSAGALNLSYALAEQGVLGLSFYLRDMTDPKYLSRRRLVAHHAHPLMDLRNVYLMAEQEKRLNIERLINNHGRDFYIGVTNIDTMRGEMIIPYEAGDRFFEYLMAGATLPIVAGEPWIIHNQRYYDGGLYYIDPYQMAEELGSTHVFSLGTTLWGTVPEPWNKLTRQIVDRLDDDYNDPGNFYADRLEEYCEVFSHLSYGETRLNNIALYRHAVKSKTGISILTNDRGKLMDGAKEGYQSVLDLFAPGARSEIAPITMEDSAIPPQWLGRNSPKN